MEPVSYGIFPVQDVFEIKGRGVVATGRVEDGTFQREDNVGLLSAGLTKTDICIGDIIVRGEE